MLNAIQLWRAGIFLLGLAALSGLFFMALQMPAAAGERLARAEAVMLMAPVLKRPIARNAVIRERDLLWVEIDAERLPRQAILEADRIVGMAAKRGLRAGRAIRTRDVEEPVAINKGDVVAIVFMTDNMTLTARGRALEAAPTGQGIRVLNAHSRRTIEATAVAPGIVSANPLSHAEIVEAMQ